MFKGVMLHVGVAEWKVGEKPDALRTTLGSCVGVALYAERKGVGGLAHVLLGHPQPGKIVNKGKYARPAVQGLVQDLQREGVQTEELRARIFGGASMFEAQTSSFLQNIGANNVIAVKEVLAELKIPILFEDTGGSVGRTVTFFLDDGRILLRANGKEKYIYKA